MAAFEEYSSVFYNINSAAGPAHPSILKRGYSILVTEKEGPRRCDHLLLEPGSPRERMQRLVWSQQS